MKVQMLTKNPCPSCVRLKTYLEFGLGDKYKDDIEVVHQQENELRFNELKEQHQVQATPVLISGDHVLHQWTPVEVEAFLREHIGR